VDIPDIYLNIMDTHMNGTEVSIDIVDIHFQFSYPLYLMGQNLTIKWAFVAKRNKRVH